MKKKRSFFLFLVLLMLFISQETICAWFQKDITVEIDTVMEQKIRELEKELTDAQQIMNINRPNEELLYTRLLLRDPFLFYDYGLLETNSKKEGWIKNLTKECDIQIGDEVYTSGLTEIPAGILIGKVSDLKEDNLGLVKEVKIDFAADIDHISYVIVYQKEMLP